MGINYLPQAWNLEVIDPRAHQGLRNHLPGMDPIHAGVVSAK